MWSRRFKCNRENINYVWREKYAFSTIGRCLRSPRREVSKRVICHTNSELIRISNIILLARSQPVCRNWFGLIYHLLIVGCAVKTHTHTQTHIHTNKHEIIIYVETWLIRNSGFDWLWKNRVLWNQSVSFRSSGRIGYTINYRYIVYCCFCFVRPFVISPCCVWLSR